MTEKLAIQHENWLAARGISTKLADKFGLYTTVQSFPPDGDQEEWTRAKCIAVPYRNLLGEVVNHKYRRVEPKQHVMDKGGERCLWNLEAVKRAAGGTLVITEGEWDAMLADDLGWHACSVPNGTPKKRSDDPSQGNRYQYITDAAADLVKVKRFIIAVDGDEAGIALRADLIALLTPQRCSFVEYPVGKDLTDVYLAGGAESVSVCLHDARPVPIEGLHSISDFPDVPELPMIQLDIPGLEDKFGLVPGTFAVFTGYAGIGKSSLVLKMIANLMASGVHITVGSFETLTRPILERRLMAALVEAAERDPTIWKGERSDKARRILASRLKVIANTPDEEHELDLDRLVDLMEAAVMQYGTQLVLLDPFNEIEHKRGRNETETEYVGRFILTIKRFCHRTGCAVWLVAHPRKPHTDGNPKPPSLYDLSGSANFANKADYGVVIHRHDISGTETEVKIVKVRMGLPGKICRANLRWVEAMSRYVDAMDASAPIEEDDNLPY